MRVIETGQDRAALGVDDDGLRAPEALHLAARPDFQDLVALDGHRFGHRPVAVGGVDLAIDDDQIDRSGVIALRADDQAGDERRADDEGDEIRGDAARHARILPHRLTPQLS